jgi:hypothetical protein
LEFNSKKLGQAIKDSFRVADEIFVIYVYQSVATELTVFNFF